MFHAVFDVEICHQDNLKDGDPLKESVLSVVDAFDTMIDILRNPKSFPNEEINQLVSLAYRLVGDKVVQCAAMDCPTPSVNFAFTNNKIALFAVPFELNELYTKNPVFLMGGVVVGASRARDFWNGKSNLDLVADPNYYKEETDRALGYEAEYLWTLQKMGKLKPNDYQSKIMEKFPNGLKDVEHLLYKRKKYRDAS